MNKYQQHSKARLRDNLRDLTTEHRKGIEARRIANREHNMVDEFDEEHKESMEVLNARISSAFTVARQMFEVLSASNLSAEGRISAMQFLNVLVHRFGGK
jgi:hypothetical protein